MTIPLTHRPPQRSPVRLATAILCLALPGLGAVAAEVSPVALALQAPRPVFSQRSRAPVEIPDRSHGSDRLHFLQPQNGAVARIGDLRLLVAPVPAGGRTVEVLLAWNSDPRGVVPVETCRVPLDQLVAGVRLPATATRGRTGRFTIQARVIAPDQGAISAPVDVTLVTAEAFNRTIRSPRTYDERSRDSRPSPVGDFSCID
jgi:hypothetical protein